MRKPPGYPTVFPYLMVADAAAYARFLCDGLGAVEEGRTVAPDGRLANVRLRFGDDGAVMVAEVPADRPPCRSSHYLYVTDADAAMARAVAAGGREVLAVADRPYGDRQGGIEDPAGTVWWISERLVDGPYED
jgi:PhnB protein